MTTALASLIAQRPEWSIVLSAYAAAEKALLPTPKRMEHGVTPVEADDDARWIPRLNELDDVAPELLSRVHGQLIAEGLLRFNLLGRMDGIGYRLTPAGRQALGIASQADAEGEGEGETESEAAA